jgi:formamidopyrimidine-DNA glycosylase
LPEYPDLTVYVEALERFTANRVLERVDLASVSLLRSVDPPLSAVVGRRARGARRLAKRLVLELEDDLFLVFHLMVAGRLRWKKRGTRPPRRGGHASFQFENGCLLLTEASTKKRATLHVVRGEAGLADHDPGGVEVMDLDLDGFRAVLQRENHTLKRALTDPHLFAAIGNAYSDEILHRARLSPVKWTSRLSDDEIERLHDSVGSTLSDWTARLRAEVGDDFPDKVTAFHQGMAVHGRYREPCPDCGAPVQRIVYAENETNYCAACQTEGKVLADRALSRLLKADWPRTVDELERRRATGSSGS